MKIIKPALVLSILALASGCGGGSSSSAPEVITATVTVTPTPAPAREFLYVSSFVSSNVSAFEVNTADGVLAQVNGTVTAGPLEGFVTAPNGLFGYALAQLNGVTNVLPMAIDPQTGNLSALAPAAVPDTPLVAAVDPQGKFLFVQSNNNGEIDALPIQADGTLGTSQKILAGGTDGLQTTVGGQMQFVLAGGTPILLLTQTQPGANVLSFAETNLATGALTPGADGSVVAAPGSLATATINGNAFAYVALATTTQNCAVFSIAPGTGNLSNNGAPVTVTDGSHNAFVFTTAQLNGTAVLYAMAASTSDQLATFSIQSNGQIGSQTGSTLSTGQGVPLCASVDPLKGLLYVATSDNLIFDFTLSSSTLAPSVGPVVANQLLNGNAPTAMAIVSHL